LFQLFALERTFLAEPFEQFARPMFRIGSAAAVAADEEFASAAERPAQDFVDMLDVLETGGERGGTLEQTGKMRIHGKGVKSEPP